MLQKLTDNSLLRFIYRLLKCLYFSLIYKTNIYKILLPHNIKNFLDPLKKYKLVVCHNGGGGTVSYMKNKYKDVGQIIFLRNTVSADKDYIYSLENSDTGVKIYIKPKQISFIKNAVNEVHVIAAESYMSLEFILPWIVSLNVPITYDLHDYHCVWYETHFIHKGQYLTDEALQKSYLRYAFRKITFQQWHNLWTNFISHVQIINAFSESSKNIFAKYYPEYSDKVKVTPHSTDYIKCGKVQKLSDKFAVGIFGIILGEDKGSEVVRSFLEFSKDKDYEIFINGELNSACKVYSPNIHYMGRYDVNHLNTIIEEQGITAVFFPSICPETFSYTVSELIHVEVPAACFNLGAQAEKISKYKYGQIISENTNEEILAALKAAYEKGLNDGK